MLATPFIQKGAHHLKTLDTINICQKPDFSLDVSQHMYTKKIMQTFSSIDRLEVARQK